MLHIAEFFDDQRSLIDCDRGSVSQAIGTPVMMCSRLTLGELRSKKGGSGEGLRPFQKTLGSPAVSLAGSRQILLVRRTDSQFCIPEITWTTPDDWPRRLP
jgi:hypothetical protein